MLDLARAQQTDGLEDRLLAEAVRLREVAQGFGSDEPEADAAARAADGDLEHRILVRARSLSFAGSLEAALSQIRSVATVVIAIALLIALISGATATQVVFGSQVNGPINFFWVLGSLLGIHTLALVAWLIFMFLGSSTTTGGGLLGSAALALARRVNRWLHQGPLQVAAAQATTTVYGTGNIGRWTLSALTHALWLAFLVGCLVLVLLVLSTKQYNFAWETTILSEHAYTTLVRIIAEIPGWFGFSTPDAQQVVASRWTGARVPPAEARSAWAGLLVGSIVAYGLLPRALFLVVSLAAWRRATAHYHLDTSRRGYTRLHTRLQPIARNIGVVDEKPVPEESPAQSVIPPPRPLPVQGEGPVAIVGLEIGTPETGWPPSLDGIDWFDLGFVEGRSDRHRVLDQITSPIPMPSLLVVVCSLAATPDRGTGAFVRDLKQTAGIPMAMVLTEGQHLRRRGHTDQVGQRVEDWRHLATQAGVPDDRVIEVDLDHLTDISRGRLAKVTGTRHRAPNAGGHIEQAFALILEHVARWAGQPGLPEQAELQREIARLYRGKTLPWQDLLRIRPKPNSDYAQQLKTGAHHMLELLPARLRMHPRWLTAGALAGSLACVAASTLVAPVAITALPAWAGLGAVISTFLPGSNASAAEPLEERIDLTDVVASAALFALVLELQDRDETTITHILDEVVGAEDPPIIETLDGARAWLDTLRGRLYEVVKPGGLA
jgi:hypothetical protein